MKSLENAGLVDTVIAAAKSRKTVFRHLLGTSADV